MSADLHAALATAILIGGDFTADDVTAAGTRNLDDGHKPNAQQNGVGSLFRYASAEGLIEFTGDIARSVAPHRKGGTNRVWRATPAGRRWAQRQLANR